MSAVVASIIAAVAACVACGFAICAALICNGMRR